MNRREIRRRLKRAIHYLIHLRALQSRFPLSNQLLRYKALDVHFQPDSH